MDALRKQKLFDALGPLPLKARSWPRGVAALAWALIALICWWIILRAPELHAQIPAQLKQPIIFSLLPCLLGLCIFAYFMWFGQTAVTDEGIEQDWLFKRRIEWGDIRMAKFVPLLFSKRLVCFPHRGRPVVFHAGARELEIAFAHISLAYAKQ